MAISVGSFTPKIRGETIERTLKLLKTSIWDHKWRLVVFDIPEKYATLRDKVRTILKRSGFVKLQQSVWVFPHILYGVLDRIEGEESLRKIFHL